MKSILLPVLLLIGLPILSMEPERLAINAPSMITIIDGNGQSCLIDPLVIRSSNTLQNFIEENPGAMINFQECGQRGIDAHTLALITKALYEKKNSLFWEKLSIGELERLHKADDYLDFKDLNKHIIKALLKKNPKAFEKYLFLGSIKNADFDSNMVRHYQKLLATSAGKALESADIRPFAKEIILSNKNITNLMGLKNISLSKRLNCRILHLSRNNLGTLNTDILFEAFPLLRTLVAVNSNITKVKGHLSLPVGSILGLSRNQISSIDLSILKNAPNCFLDLNNNKLSQDALRDLQAMATTRSMIQKCKQKIDQCFNNFAVIVCTAVGCVPGIFFCYLNMIVTPDDPIYTFTKQYFIPAVAISALSLFGAVICIERIFLYRDSTFTATNQQL